MPELTVLEQQLVELGAAVDWPPTPSLGPAIKERMGSRRQWF